MIDRQLKTTFGTVSGIYDSSRVGYPQKLIDDVVLLSGIHSDGKILEVGCGTGKATFMFGEKGYDIVALDISEDLVEVARKNTAQFSNVNYQVVSFEDAALEPNSFDLIVAAQSWHWTDPNVRYKKADKILKDSGAIAVFYKYPDDTRSAFVAKVRNLYRKHCPKFPDDFEQRQQHFRESILASNFFVDLEERTYNVDFEFSKEEYVGLIKTLSYVAALGEEDKTRFLADLSDLLASKREPLSIPYKYTLIVAKRQIPA
jgi:SAM-dependent methyltransferase